jgi:hypothetical protein
MLASKMLITAEDSNLHTHCKGISNLWIISMNTVNIITALNCKTVYSNKFRKKNEQLSLVISFLPARVN